MSELVDWISAQLDADEAAARLADGVTDKVEDDWQDVTQPITLADTLRGESWAKKYGYAYEHISRHSPARVLVEVEAKRAIVAEFVAVGDPGSYTVGYAGRKSDILFGQSVALERVLRHMALPFADRPGFDETWRP